MISEANCVPSKRLSSAISTAFFAGCSLSASAQFGPSLELSSLNGGNGIVLVSAAPSDNLGISVSAAGDINGDGVDDVIVGAETADPNGLGSGASYVVFGTVAGQPSPLNLSSLNGLNGFIINGAPGGSRAGGSVSAAGDVNGDGIDDLIVGAAGSDPNSNDGASYVVFGATGGLTSPLELSTIDGTNGFVIVGLDGTGLDGLAVWTFPGLSVSAAGDVNGDGIDDVIVGDRGADPTGSRSGASYVVFGAVGGLPSPLPVTTLNGTNGFAITGEVEGDRLGTSVSAAGDVNGDSVDDLIVGAMFASPNGSRSGASYVVLGSQNAFAAEINVTELDGTNG